jgi:hypothetical protein
VQIESEGAEQIVRAYEDEHARGPWAEAPQTTQLSGVKARTVRLFDEDGSSTAQSRWDYREPHSEPVIVACSEW